MYRLRLLGSLTLEGPTGPLSGRVIQRKRLALLALLAAARDQVLSRDKLVGYLWPESDDERARHNLSDTLHILNKELGDGAVLALGEMLRLNPDVVWTDVRELEEALERGEPGAAADLYRGPFLDGVHLGEALEFERWVEGERERCAGLYARALEALALEAEDEGDYGKAAEWWKRLAAQDPYDSRLVVRVMEALAAAGDVANALQHARAHEMLLREELEVEPSAEVLAAAERLREASAARAATERTLRPIEARLAEALEEPGKRATYRVAWARWALVAGALVAALVGAIALLVDLPGSREPAAERPSVAVLPLAILSADPENEYFSNGIVDDVITLLSKISGLKVISSHSSMQYKGSEKSLPEIADELGVATILELGVRREGDRVRINAQLVDVASGEHLWAEQYNREIRDILAIQTDVAQQIASALRATLTLAEEERLAQVPTANLEAYEYYLRGNNYLYRSSCFVAEECRLALQMYEQAVALDPNFALAYAMLSFAHGHLYYWSHDLSSARLAQTREAVDRALELQPDLPEAHWALGRYYYTRRDYDRAMEEYRSVLGSQPNNSEALFDIGTVQRRWGEWEQAATKMSEALELDPRNGAYAWDLAATYTFMRSHAEAERYYDRAISLAPDMGLVYGLKSALYLTTEGNVEKARQSLEGKPDVEAGPRRGGWPWLQAWWAYLDVLEGHYEEALERLSLGSDSVTYYFAKAGIYHLSNQPQLKHAYYDSLRIVLEAAVAGHPEEARYHGILGIAYAGLGRKDDAVREGQSALTLLPLSEDAFYGTAMNRLLAETYVLVGEHDAAIDQLELLLSIPAAYVSAPWIRVDPVWDPLRGHPRFQALLQRYE